MAKISNQLGKIDNELRSEATDYVGQKGEGARREKKGFRT